MTAGRVFERQMRARVPDANVLFVDPRIAEGMTDDVLHAVNEAQVVVAAVYAAPVPGGMRNSAAVPDATGTLLTKMVEHARKKMAVVALGSPYVVAGFPEIQNYLCTFSNETVSELSAVKALFGEIPIRGHLPVSIPNVAERGSGIERQPRVASGEVPHAHTEISRR